MFRFGLLAVNSPKRTITPTHIIIISSIILSDIFLNFLNVSDFVCMKILFVYMLHSFALIINWSLLPRRYVSEILVLLYNHSNATLRRIQTCVMSRWQNLKSHKSKSCCVSLTFPIQLSLVLLTNCQLYSHSNCLQYCTVIIVYYNNFISFKFENFTPNSSPPVLSVTNQQTVAPVTVWTLAVT